MAVHSRYSLGKNQVGVDNGVLKNKLSINNQKELDDAEMLLFSDTYKHFFDLLAQDQLTIDLSLLFKIHKYFFEPLYSWAGKIRIVNVSKDGILFAPIEYLAGSLISFESQFLRFASTDEHSKKQIVRNLAVIHCELNAIHPFREGNGRTIRLFLDLMASDAGYNPIDWSRRSQTGYIAACIDGMSKKYTRMEKIIYAGLKKQK